MSLILWRSRPIFYILLLFLGLHYYYSNIFTWRNLKLTDIHPRVPPFFLSQIILYSLWFWEESENFGTREINFVISWSPKLDFGQAEIQTADLPVTMGVCYSKPRRHPFKRVFYISALNFINLKIYFSKSRHFLKYFCQNVCE